MLIAAVPAYRNRDINPCNALLYGAVQRAGVTVREFGATTLMGPRPELAELTGDDWVQTYEGQLTPEILAAAMASTPFHASPDLSELDWLALGQQTTAFFNEVVSTSLARRAPRRKVRVRKKRMAMQRRRGY